LASSASCAAGCIDEEKFSRQEAKSPLPNLF
jgi:hypothetical protein